MNRNVRLSIMLKIALIIVILIGVSSSIFFASSFTSGVKTLMFYTLQSNIFVMVIEVVFLINQIRVYHGRASFITDKWRTAKYILVCGVLLTFVVFGLLLTPVLPIAYTFSVTSISLHFIAPLIAITDFFLFDYKKQLSVRTIALTIIPPLYYLLFVLGCIGLGIRFPPDNKLVPYFFLDYEQFGWFSFTSNGIGVGYWIIILMMLLLGINLVLVAISKKIRVEKMDIN